MPLNMAETERELMVNQLVERQRRILVERGNRRVGNIETTFINQHRAMFGEDPRGVYTGVISYEYTQLNFSQKTIELGGGGDEDTWYLKLRADRHSDLPWNVMEIESGDGEKHMHIIHTPKPEHETKSHINIYADFVENFRATETPFVSWLENAR